MERLTTLHRNTRNWGIIQLALVYGLFGFLVVFVWIREDDLRPLGAMLAGLLAPTLLRRTIADHPETTEPLLNAVLWGLGVFVFVGGWGSEFVEIPAWLESMTVWGLSFAAPAYATAFFWLYSDPDIVMVERD